MTSDINRQRDEVPAGVCTTLWAYAALGIALLFGSSLHAADSFVKDTEERQRIEQAVPAKATVQPAKARRLLIFSRNVGYGGHRPSRAHACEAFTLMGRKTGAFETTVSEDPAVFERESLQRFDAVFLNNTIGNTFADPRLRQNLLEFFTGGGGLLGVHGTSIAFMNWQWPPIEDWPEFGNMIGARGAYHRDDKEHVWIKIDEPDHPLSRAFGGHGFERRDEFFRFHAPYSRQLDRVLLSMDVAKTDLSGIKPDEHLLREDNDYAVAWIRNYGRGRVFYCSLAHSDSVFCDATMLQFYLDAAQFVLGDLPAPTTPSAKLSPAVLAQEKLGWRLGVEAYTFHKFTFFETIEKTAELGLPYIGGLSFMQQVSKDIPKHFDQNLTDDELRQIRLKMESAGLRMLTYYAQDIPKDEAGCRKLFEFGRKMGFETFMCEPTPEQLDLLDTFANEYGINVAIHNHGQNISPQYWRPEGVLKACEGRSKRIGAAPDLGYWLRSGIDPVEAARLLKHRIITVQMHDLHEPGSNGHDVPWGTGIGKSEEFFRELHQQGIKPTMIGLEYSHDWMESMPKAAKCIEFFNATTLKLAAETPIPPTPATSAETVQDADGNTYHTVKIGNQVWTVENLRTTKFNDGTPIPNVTDDAGWKSLTTPGFCYYENNPEHGKKYGALYNWYAASSDKIAPKGWRVPTHEEQMALRDYLIANGYNYDGTTEGNRVAKSMAAKTDWIYKPTNEGNDPVPDIGTVGKNAETNNKSGFSALPAGSRWNDGSFHALGTSVYWWSTTPDGESIKAHMSSVHTWFAKYGNNQHHKRSGFCIRLIRDEDHKERNATTRHAGGIQATSFGNPDKIDVAVVTGGHGFHREAFFAMFNGCDDLRLVEVPLKDESEVFEDVSKWDYDVLVLYNMTQKISQKRQDNFVRLLKDKGVGVVVVHHAEAAFQSWLEYHQIIGTAYIYFDVKIDGKLWPHCKCKGGQDIAVSVRDGQHLITRGMKDFTIHDETYKGRRWLEGNHVLLTTAHPENDEAVAWTRQYGRSRVFNLQFGHDEKAYACPEYRELLVRGIRWVAGTADTAKDAAASASSSNLSAQTELPPDGLKLWFRADRGVTHSENKVSQWEDQSGSNLHAKLNKGQPMLLTSAMGGKPAIHFNGKGDVLEFEGWSPNGLTAMTTIIVSANTEFQPEPYKGGWDEGGHCGTLQSVLNWPEQPGTGPGAWGNVILSAFQKSVSYRFGTGQKSNSNNWKRPASIGDSPTMTTAIHDGATEKLYVEGELVWTQTDKLTTIKNCATNGFIGRWSHGGDNSGWFAGNVAEIVVYAKALDDSDRKKVEGYLKAKYFAKKSSN